MNIDDVVEQLKKDEDFTPVSKWDVKQFTYGYGTRAPRGGVEIDKATAEKLLRLKVDDAYTYFKNIFAGHILKFNDVRANAFINLIFNMGPGVKGHHELGGLQSFEKTLALIFDNPIVPWGKVANELKNSKWYGQVGVRAERICNEIKTGIKA